MKFKSKKLNYCMRHRFYKNSLFRCLPGKLQSLFLPKSDTKHSVSYGTDVKLHNLKEKLVKSKNEPPSVSLDKNEIIEQPNCLVCRKENKGFYSQNSTREELYNSQPSLMFKYHVSMCSLVYIALCTVVFISEIQKYAVFH